jgi:DNA repair protein RadC
MMLRELTVHYTVKHTPDGPVAIGRQVTMPSAAAELLRPVLAHEPGEVFGILCLSIKRTVIAYHEVSRGTLNATLVDGRAVFQAAILANAASIILAHVHPSGDSWPSADDQALTKRLIAGGQLLGIEVSDHIIIGAGGGYFSFKEGGYL